MVDFLVIYHGRIRDKNHQQKQIEEHHERLFGKQVKWWVKPPTSKAKMIYECFLKWWYPQIIHFNRVFHYKPSILIHFGVPLFLETPIWQVKVDQLLHAFGSFFGKTGFPNKETM